MKQLMLRMIMLLIVFSMLFTTFSIFAYADFSENDVKEENVEDSSQDTRSRTNKIGVDLSAGEGNDKYQLVQLRSDALKRTHSTEKIVQNDYTLEMNIEHDAILVEYSYSDGIKMLSDSFFTQTKDVNFDIPLTFSYDSALDTNDADVYNISEDILNIKVTVFKDECVVDEITKQICVLSTPYGSFTSDVDHIISKREYLSYLQTNNLVDQATYDDMDRFLHCSDERNTENLKFVTAQCVSPLPHYAKHVMSDEQILKMPSVNESEGGIASTVNAEAVVHQNYVEVNYDIINASTSSLTISGEVTWYDDAGNSHPAQYVLVDIMDDNIVGHQTLASITTDGNGEFECTLANKMLLENGYDIFLRVYCGNNETMVHDFFDLGHYLLFGTFHSSEAYYITTTVQTDVISNVYDCSGSDNGVRARAFSIANALYYAREYECSMNGGSPLNNNPVIAHYPMTISDTSFALPIFQAGKIILDESAHEDWSVVLHEYGHVVENKMGMFNIWDDGLSSLFSKKGFVHDSDYKLTDYYGENNKDKALYIAWFEGWALYYSFSVQKKYVLYSTSYSYPGTSTNIVANVNISNTSGWGEDNEKAVAAALVKVVYYQYLLTAQEMWNISKNNSPKSYFAMHELLLDTIVTKYAINENNLYMLNKYLNILEEEGFSASQLTMAFSSYSPTFSWREPSENYNDQNGIDFSYDYILYIKGAGNTFQYTKPLNDTTTYTLTVNEWNTIQNSCPNGFYWYVEASEKRDPSDSAFISPCYLVNTYKKNSISHDYYWDQYSEWQIGLKAGEHCDFHISFTVDGYHLIQTFGTMDTVMELYSSSGVLLVSQDASDDCGYESNALISYYFDDADIYILRIKARGTNSTFAQYFKLSIVTTYRHDSYESAYGPYSTTSVGWSLGVTRVALFRYKFNQSGTVTFTMSSNDGMDTLLFIIDPSSNTLIQEYTGSNTSAPNLFDDDSGGNGQAQIKKQVVANKEYLAIIAFYDPDETGHFSISTSFS